MEELVPKETGRDARLDKKKAANQARKEHEHSPGLAGTHVQLFHPPTNPPT